MFSNTRLAHEFSIHLPLPFSGGRWCLVATEWIYFSLHVCIVFVIWWNHMWLLSFLLSSCVSTLHVLHGVRSLLYKSLNSYGAYTLGRVCCNWSGSSTAVRFAFRHLFRICHIILFSRQQSNISPSSSTSASTSRHGVYILCFTLVASSGVRSLLVISFGFAI